LRNASTGFGGVAYGASIAGIAGALTIVDLVYELESPVVHAAARG
jgi:hypothetical protein